MAEDCIFCKIISGEIPCEKLYEDEHTFAFLDIKPIHDGHALVVPKAHHKDIYEIPEDVLAHLSGTVKKVATAVKKAVGADGINIGMNNEPAAGQVVFHAHFHVIPRKSGDGLKHWERPSDVEPEFKETAEKIKSLLS